MAFLSQWVEVAKKKKHTHKSEVKIPNARIVEILKNWLCNYFIDSLFVS